MWAAEGFVEDRGTETALEEVAEEYLRELAQRSLIRVTERNEFKKGKEISFSGARSCQGNDTDHIKKGEVCSYLQSPRSNRCWQCGKPCICAQWSPRVSTRPKHLRTFLLFDRHVSIPWINTASSNFRLLRVLYSCASDTPSSTQGHS